MSTRDNFPIETTTARFYLKPAAVNRISINEKVAYEAVGLNRTSRRNQATEERCYAQKLSSSSLRLDEQEEDTRTREPHWNSCQ